MAAYPTVTSDNRNGQFPTGTSMDRGPIVFAPAVAAAAAAVAERYGGGRWASWLATLRSLSPVCRSEDWPVQSQSC